MQELLGHKTLAMTLRYSHLSPAHQLEAVQRLVETPTATTAATPGVDEKRPAADGAEKKDGGGGLDRTADLGL